MTTMNPSDQLFLSVVRNWTQESGASTYLVGPENGALSLDIETKAFSRHSQRMSSELKDALKATPGIHDCQVSAHQTHEALKGASNFPLKADILAEVARERAIDSLNNDEDDDNEATPHP